MILISLIFLLSNCSAVYDDSTFNDYAILLSEYAYDWSRDNAVYPVCYDANDKEFDQPYQSTDSDISVFITDNNAYRTAMLPNEFEEDIRNSHLKIDYENHDIFIMRGNDGPQNIGLGVGMDMMYMQSWDVDEVRQYFSCVNEKKLTHNYHGYDLPLPNKFPSQCNTDAEDDSQIEAVDDDGIDNPYSENPYYNPDPSEADLIIVEIFYDEEESRSNFYPQDIAIPAGKMVAWFNEDSTGAIHGIKSANSDEQYESGELGEYMLFTHTFKDKGEFPYYCAFHPSMTGTITVK